MNRNVTGLVVEADVSAGDRGSKFKTSIGQPPHRLAELPHHRRVLRGAEVQAVRHCQRCSPGGGNISIRLGQGKLGTVVGIEFGEPSIAVGGYRNPAPGLLIHSHHA